MCSSSTSTHGSRRSRLVVDSTVHSLPLTRTPNPTGEAQIASWSANDTWGALGRATRAPYPCVDVLIPYGWSFERDLTSRRGRPGHNRIAGARPLAALRSPDRGLRHLRVAREGARDEICIRTECAADGAGGRFGRLRRPHPLPPEPVAGRREQRGRI